MSIQCANLTENDQVVHCCLSSESVLAKSTTACDDTTVVSNAVLLATFVVSADLSIDDTICTLSESLLILSNLSFLSSSWSWIVLHSRDFDHRRKLCSNHRLIALLRVFWIVSETIESFLCDLNMKKSFWIEIFDKLRLLFRSSWCSWSVVTAMSNRDLKWLTLVAENVNEIEWLKSLAVCCDLLIVLKSLASWRSSSRLFLTFRARARSLD